MAVIEEAIKPWPADKRVVGQAVRAALLPHLRPVLQTAYASVGMSNVPEEVLEQEERNFKRISIGDFSPEYFAEQAVIARNIAKQVPYTDYLAGYGFYAAGLTSACWFPRGTEPVME